MYIVDVIDGSNVDIADMAVCNHDVQIVHSGSTAEFGIDSRQVPHRYAHPC